MNRRGASKPRLINGIVVEKPPAKMPNRKTYNGSPRELPPRAVTWSAKRCSTCRGYFSSGGFARDNSHESGLQAQCRRCRAQWEIDGGLSRARAAIEKEPVALTEWQALAGGVEAALQRRWDESRGECHWCGAGLNEWSAAGHCLDRINSLDCHRPANVVLCCWPCNCRKGSTSPTHWAPIIGAEVATYGRGRVPHSAVDPKRYRRRIAVDMTAFIATDPQLSLPLTGKP